MHGSFDVSGYLTVKESIIHFHRLSCLKNDSNSRITTSKCMQDDQ